MIEENKVIKTRYNPNMGMECYSKPDTIFFIDISYGIKIGDIVKCERDDNGFYKRVWVNDKLMTKNHFDDIHKIQYQNVTKN